MCNHCDNGHKHTEHCCGARHNDGIQKLMIYKIIFVFTLMILTIVFKPEIIISQAFQLPQSAIKFLLYFILYIVIAHDVIKNAFKNLLSKKFLDENFLMTAATFGAFGIGEYPEALMVMLLYQTGELFTDFALHNSKKSISGLMDLKPEYANLVKEAGIEKIPPQNVKIDDIILIKAGEKIPLDGIVVEGRSSVDTSNLTGEVLPVSVKPEDRVISGCINLDGVIKIKVTSEFQNSTVSKIIEMMENASDKKAKAENFITKFAKVYTPLVVALALMLAVVPCILGGEFAVWFKRALTFLVISCPCALVISVPLGFFASIGAASKHGILIKGGNYIEALSKAKIAVFDKTGTLTSGVFKVLEIHPEGNLAASDFIKFAAMAEHFSTHPVARSIQSAYTDTVNPAEIKCLKEISGLGVTAEIQGKDIIIGNASLMEKFNIPYNKDAEGKTVIHMALNNEYAGFLTVGDTVKQDTVNTLRNLKNKARIEKIVVLTGDSGLYGLEDPEISSLIDESYCSLLPNQKLERVEALLKAKKPDSTLIFTGDGINDAPVLSRADVGIAMGKMGSDIAIGAADAVIMDDNPAKIPAAIEISKKTINIVKQNIVFILFIKVLFLVLGALGAVTMWGAVFADVGVSILAILNSMRILYFKVL